MCVGGKLEHEKMKKHQRFLGTISIEDEEKEKTKKKEEAYRRRLEKQKEKYTCECGSVLRKGDKATHKKCRKYQGYLNQQMTNKEE